MRGIVWPEPPLAWQLDRTQWLSATELARAQRRQLDALVAHAVTSPHYEDALRGWSGEWATLPILARPDISPRLASRRYPADHGRTREVLSSRTTGEPVRVLATEATQQMWNAITLRDHAWHRRDLREKLAVIRYTEAPAPPPGGAKRAGWGPATDALAPDAPLVVLSVASTTDEQIAWLEREDPAYLLVYPTVLEAICRRGAKLPSLREVRTVSEALSDDTRALCREALGVPLVDVYSAEEVGYLALQCPDHACYHVQSESVLVEILRDDGTPCEPGEVGRVIVTALRNFATPILRYDIGDYAEVGAPCACGRGLPALTRITGRRRGMLRYPDGRTTWPLFTAACRRAAHFAEIQLVQDAIDKLRLRVVPDGPLDPRALVAALHGALGRDFAITVEVVDALSRTPRGKLEEFVSLVGTT